VSNKFNSGQTSAFVLDSPNPFVCHTLRGNNALARNGTSHAFYEVAAR